MKRSLLLVTVGLAVLANVADRAEGISCATVSVRYIVSVIGAARYCLLVRAPRGYSCAYQNLLPNRRATYVNQYCPAGTVDRLSCTARQAIVAAGLSYDSLPETGFTHVCSTSACGNALTEFGEQCDDGNVVDGDGCSAVCQLESLPCGDTCAGIAPVSGTAIKTQQVADGLINPLAVTAPPGDVGRIFIVEQPGRIRIVKWGALQPTPFLAIQDQVSCCGEQGLFSLAFHPQYATNGRFFVDYTNNFGNTVVAEYRVGPDPDVADPLSESIVLRVNQPFANHNGGQLAFGPDGFLYIALGDGGSSGDLQNNAQNTTTLLGKILRIDVDSATPYAAPPANPFAGVGDPGADEIWSLGLRNPWRFSFDRITGDMYIGDVGQDRFEEIDFQPAGTGGLNFGWNIVEGDGHCYGSSTCDQTGLTLPALEYGHGEGCSVTGGFVYRGCAMPDLRGTYFYADFCSDFIRTFRMIGGAVTDSQDRTADLTPSGGSLGSIAGFGEDARGELYICSLAGSVFKIVPGP